MWEKFDRETEAKIQEFWKKEKILQKSRAKNKNGKPYYLVDGPPFPTGHIHLGTALNKSLKDCAMRFKRMQGFDIYDIAGWDCHGLPTELKVEKELGISGKEDIESKIGAEKFVKACEEFSTRFIKEMTREFENLGVWMDFENAFKTLDNEYIESTWWSFAQAAKKGMLYKGVYPIQVCPQCETPLSFNEIEHKKLTDTSIYVKFPIEGKENEFLVIWTTTPWTLPGNTGVMAHPEFEYVQVQLSNGEKWVLAKELAQKVFDTIETAFTVLKTFKGKELEGLKYKSPLEKNLAIDWSKVENSENRHRVILSARYVNLDDGTGLVHCAPGHGKEDYDAGKKAGLPVISPVGIDGLLLKETGKYAGKKAKVVDSEIIGDLEAENALVFKHDYSHEYPVCWRCDSPLLMISIPQWFLGTESLKDRAKQLNEEVQWIPKWVKDRFKNWVEEGVSDWPITRDRYWGTPAPIWECKACGGIKVIESAQELKKNALGKHDFAKMDFHKPWIDEVRLKCGKCGKEMERVPEILDGWFDAGVCSWAGMKYPKEKKSFEKYWPSDLNIEGRDQIRGWWNAELMCSMIAFDRKPFKSIGMHGFSMDLEKRKMSKSKGNIITPAEVISKECRDSMRYYFVQLMHGEDFSFDWNAFKNIGKTFSTLQNVFNYASMYLSLEELDSLEAKALEKMGAEDLWIVSRANSLVEECVKSFEASSYAKATEALDCFINEELSKTYVKLVRERSEGNDRKAVEKALNYSLTQVLKLLAPIAPHLAEFYYQRMQKRKEPSVHLLRINAEKGFVDRKLEEEMQKAKGLVESLLALREEQKLRLRWALKEAVVQTSSGKELSKTRDLIARMAKVKKLSESSKVPLGKNWAKKEVSGEIVVFLDTSADESLKNEWELAELLRRVQEARKKAGLKPGQKASLLIECSDEKFLKEFGKKIEAQTSTEIRQGRPNAEREKLVEREFAIEVKA